MDNIATLERQANTGDRQSIQALYRARERQGLPKWTIAEANENQKKLCEDNGWPHFAPRTGLCYSCRKNIYDPNHPRGRDGRGFITGCIYCCRSYCD